MSARTPPQTVSIYTEVIPKLQHPYIRLVALVFVSLFLFGFAVKTADAGEGLKRIQTRGKLVWGADQEGGGPFVFPDAADPSRLQGFEVELAELIASELKVTAEFSQGPWDKLPDLLDRGDIDIVLNGYEWTPSRAERYLTSLPYYVYELQLVGRKNDATLESWDDLLTGRGGRKRVAVLGGAAAQDYLEQHAKDQVDLAIYEGVTDALRAVELEIDGVDANLQDLPIWTFYEPGFQELRSVGPPVGRGYYVALVRRGEPELLAEVNRAIGKALQDGRLQRIYQKYRMWNRAQAMRGLRLNEEGNFLGDSLALESSGGNSGQSSQGANATGEELSYQSVRGWGVFQGRTTLLVKAAAVTVALAVVAMPLAILMGLSLALLRMYGARWFSRIITFYVEVVRGTPLVLQLYVIFFLLPEIGISIHAFWAGVLGLAINYSAYEAEIYRAGLQAIPKGQMEAAKSLGMSQTLALRRIIVPQATRLVIPAVTNDFIALFKDTAVCSVITVVELSKEYYIQARSTGAIVELGLLTALLYFAMSYPLSIVATRLERRLAQEHAR